jgi:hypothetical protein
MKRKERKKDLINIIIDFERTVCLMMNNNAGVNSLSQINTNSQQIGPVNGV